MVTANILRRKRRAHCRWGRRGLENRARTVFEPVQHWNMDTFTKSWKEKTWTSEFSQANTEL